MCQTEDDDLTRAGCSYGKIGREKQRLNPAGVVLALYISRI